MQGPLPRLTRSRRWLLGGLTSLVLIVVVIACRRQAGREDNPETAPHAHVLAPRPLTIVPGIHLLGGLAPAAAYVVETSAGLVLIDTGLDQQARLVKREMAALKLDWHRVRAIFLTHVHGDHIGGAEHLRAATGATIYAGRGDADILRAGQPREAFFSTFFLPDPTPGPTTVDVALAGDEVVTVGDVRFRALATPGHTPGSMCYLMERGEQRVLFSGDVIWALSGDEPLGTYSAYLTPRYRGDAAAFLATLRKLRALPVPDLLLPGHPRIDRVAQSPVLTQQRWEALLDAGIHEMETLQRRFASDGANFLDGVPRKLLPDLYYLGEFKGVAVYGFFAASRFFVVNAPRGAGLSAFLRTRLRQLGLKPATPAAVLLTSGDPEETAGLAELVKECRPLVIASAAAWQAVKKDCPAGTDFLPAEQLPGKDWFAVQTIRLRGRGVGPVAYQLAWSGKHVLFSGRIPIKPTHAAIQSLSWDFSQGRGDAHDYQAALEKMAELRPQLWLPAVPSNGQNAFIYDRDWEEILAGNRALFP